MLSWEQLRQVWNNTIVILLINECDEIFNMFKKISANTQIKDNSMCMHVYVMLSDYYVVGEIMHIFIFFGKQSRLLSRVLTIFLIYSICINKAILKHKLG